MTCLAGFSITLILASVTAFTGLSVMSVTNLTGFVTTLAQETKSQQVLKINDIFHMNNFFYNLKNFYLK